MDKIYLKRMAFYGYHGVLPEESKLGQRYYVDVVLELDLKKAGQQDVLEETVNYAEVYQVCLDIVEGNQYKLIEAVAEKIAETILFRFNKVQSCTIRVIKPDPPIPGHYESVAVEIIRRRT